jgi:hypothetical protein
MLEATQGGYFEHLTSHAGEAASEERRRKYLDMGLRVELDENGDPIISGLFSKEGCHQYGGAH